MRVTKNQYLSSVFGSLIALGCVAAEPDAYEDAQVLGSCAGMLDFMAEVQAANGNAETAKSYNQKANSWRIASMGALTEAGWMEENVVTTTDSIYNASLTKWKSKAEMASQSLASDLSDATKVCLEFNEKQEEYRKREKHRRLGS